MHYARAAITAALSFVCILPANQAASGRPTASGVSNDLATPVEKSLEAESAEKSTEIGNAYATEKPRGGKVSAVKAIDTESEKWRRLKEGDVIVEADDKASSRFVSARILIHETPVNVWRVLTNPFEFAGKISPRMKEVEILHDTAERSVMKCKMEVLPPLIPFISYTVESDYRLHESVQFKRVAGSLKDFSGAWALNSREGGQATEVTYSMRVDPGLPVPQWIIRKAMKMELPRTLIALRQRVETVDATAGGAEPLKTIAAVGPIDSSLKTERRAFPALLSPRKPDGKAKPPRPKQISLHPDSAEF